MESVQNKNSFFPAFQCLSIPITLQKEISVDQEGKEVARCGFKIGGGIDQDFTKSPQGICKLFTNFFLISESINELSLFLGYTDYGIYVTDVTQDSPASRAGLRVHDKILQCNGYDMTLCT
ncbi:CLUMA_CG006619, isoform A, partial [Clunio marinus]